MAGMTIEIAQAHYDAWLAADLALATSQSYRISVNGSERQLARADAAEVRLNLEYWLGQVKLLTSAGTRRARTRYVVPG